MKFVYQQRGDLQSHSTTKQSIP